MSPLDTPHLLAQLDTIAHEIPSTIAYLAQALNTLRDLDPARREVWVRNLGGLGGQYYGRVDRIQITLRRVVRALHERKSSPYAIRPPLPNTPLPYAFTPVVSPESITPSPDVGESGTIEEETGETPHPRADEEDGLSTYAIRLEVQALRDLQRALQEMKDEVSTAREVMAG